METKDLKEMARTMDKQGMRVFIAGTVSVYGLALVYCFMSGHIFEAALLGGVMVGLGILIGWLYTSE